MCEQMGEQSRNVWTNGRASRNSVSQWESSMSLLGKVIDEQIFYSRNNQWENSSEMSEPMGEHLRTLWANGRAEQIFHSRNNQWKNSLGISEPMGEHIRTLWANAREQYEPP